MNPSSAVLPAQNSLPSHIVTAFYPNLIEAMKPERNLLTKLYASGIKKLATFESALFWIRPLAG